MKSEEVYSILRAHLDPSLKSLGFQRKKSLLSWARLHGDLNTVLWCQVSQDGWDERAGSKFTVELQRSKGSEPGETSAIRKRIGRLLTPEELEEIRRAQNDVIRSLHKPWFFHRIFRISPEVSRWYRSKFTEIAKPYDPAEDLWFRYHAPADIQRWGELISRLIPGLVATIELEA